MVVLHCLCSVPMFHLVFWWFFISFTLLVQIPVGNCIFGLLSHLVAYGRENCCAWRNKFCVHFFEATGGDCSPTDYKYIKQKEKSCAPKVLRNKGKKRNEANLGY